MTEQLLAFALATVVILLVPGPDLMLMLKNAAKGGRSGARWTATGIMVGNTIVATGAALGVTALLLSFSGVFTAVKIAGGIYLLFLGVQAFRSYLRLRREAKDKAAEAARAGEDAEPATGAIELVSAVTPTSSRGRSFRQGLLSNLLNPKLAAFYLSLFPQFELSALGPVAGHLVLAGMFVAMALVWCVLLVLFLSSLGGVFQRPKVARRTEAVAGASLVGIGGYLLAGA
jgi:threonine/homoserine/homoserine lactone efflux protein